VLIAGHAFIQNLRRGHYELATETRPAQRIAAAFHAVRGASEPLNAVQRS